MSNETKQDVFNALMADMSHGSEQWRARYDAAFPDNLPVIPKAVGEYIKANRGHMSLTSGIENAGCISEWLWGKGFDHGNDSVFARAWVLGVWSVEETGEIVKVEAEK